MDAVEIEKQKQQQTIMNDTQYSYLLDTSISDFERFVRYVNEKEGHEFITVQQLTDLLGDRI